MLKTIFHRIKDEKKLQRRTTICPYIKKGKVLTTILYFDDFGLQHSRMHGEYNVNISSHVHLMQLLMFTLLATYDYCHLLYYHGLILS